MYKVNELLREVIAEAVSELKDPRIGFVTITGVDTAPDLRHAVVFYSVLGTAEEEESTAIALASAAARLQHAVGTETRLKFTPKLHFSVDPSIRGGERIDRILRDLGAEAGEEPS
jgi:ribosome-binding factor A